MGYCFGGCHFEGLLLMVLTGKECLVFLSRHGRRGKIVYEVDYTDLECTKPSACLAYR